MADFLQTPEPFNGDNKRCEVVDMTNENEMLNITSNNILASPMDLTKTGTPVIKPSQNIHEITSPIDINLGDISSASSTPSSKRVIEIEEDSSTTATSTSATDDLLCSAEKRQKEQEESERLAWQLMEEESMNAYQMQVDYMRANPDLFSEDDLAAVGAVLQENNNNDIHHHNQQHQEGSEYDDEEDEEEGEGEMEEDNSQDWTYEQLLELGQTIGGNAQLSVIHCRTLLYTIIYCHLSRSVDRQVS